MRVPAAAAIAAILAGTAVAHPRGEQRGTPPLALLTAAQNAAGGASRVRAVKALRLTGTSEALNQFYGQTEAARQQFLPGSLEIRMLPPAHYLRIRRRTNAPVVQRTGYAGDVLLNQTVLPGSQEGGWTGPDAMQAERAAHARLMLLMLARTDTALALTARAAGSGVRVTGSGEFDATLDLDPKTRLPVALRFQVRMVATGEMREHTTSIDLRRTVDAISFPVRMTTQAAGKVLERIALERIEVNPPLTPADFARIAR
jgi:hypothetical protein